MKALIHLFLTKKYLLLLVAVLTFSACEEVIEMNLNSSDPSLVADGLIEKDSVSWLKLSYTSNYFNPARSSYIDSAVVIITDKDGNHETLRNQGNGLYRGNVLQGEVNNTYTINVTGHNLDMQAVSELKSPVSIRSLEFEKQVNRRPGQSYSNYSLIINFSDNPNSENYYLLRFIVNDTLITVNYTCIKNENYTKSGNIEYTTMNLKIQENDKVQVFVYSIDKGAYGFFNQLNDIIGSRMRRGSSTPYNPKSNFGSDVLGYFRAWSYVSRTDIIR